MRLVVAAVLIALTTGPAAADITYVYDELGRLVGVIDPASDTAVYSYDAVGNLLGIARYASSSVSIIDFQPKSGPIGTVVSIQGTGFSATPAGNTVTFNGTPASVTAATATSLTVAVPAGATTGTIGVTTAGGAATSAAGFTVTATGSTPTITSFSPSIALPGASVTITGTGYEPVPINNKVAFYGVPPAKTSVASASATALAVPVPGTVRSGPLTVATPGGTVVSAADFFVPVGGYTAAHNVFAGRITVGGASVDVAMPSTNKQGLILFDGVAGQRLNLGTVLLSGFGTPGVSIYRPDGAVLITTGSTPARYLPPLPLSGVYVIALQNGSATHTVRLTLSEEIAGTISMGGSAVTVNIPRAGQRARLTFSATAGQRVDLGMTHTMLGVTASFKTADEATTLASLSFSSPGELHSPPLPATGSYVLMVEPGSSTGSVTATLSEEVSGTITIDGASAPLSITRLGQRARVTFTGTAGQPLSLGLTAAAAGGQVTVFGPGGSTVVSPTGYSAPAASVHFALAVTGTHEILVDFTSTSTGGITLWLSQTLALTTALDGSALVVSLTRPGLRAVVTFPATTGQRASHVLSGTSFSGTLILMRPNGVVTGTPGLPGTTFVEPYNLPLTGTYYLIFQPGAAATGSVTVTSYNVPADATGSLTINGGNVAVSLSVPGQKAVLSFAGVAGASTIRVNGNAFGCVGIELSSGFGTSSCNTSFNIPVTLTTGAYTLTVDPQGAATGGLSIQVTQP